MNRLLDFPALSLCTKIRVPQAFLRKKVMSVEVRLVWISSMVLQAPPYKHALLSGCNIGREVYEPYTFISVSLQPGIDMEKM